MSGHGGTCRVNDGQDVNVNEFNLLPEEAVAILASFNENQVWWPKGSCKKFLSPGALDLFILVGEVSLELC